MMSALIKEMAKAMNHRAASLPYDLRNHTPMAFYEELAKSTIEMVRDALLKDEMVEAGARGIYNARLSLHEAGNVSDAEWQKMKVAPMNNVGTWNEYSRLMWASKKALQAALGLK